LEKVGLLIKTLIILIFIIIWTCMDLSLFELYLKFMTVMYFILFYLNLLLNVYFLNNFVNTRDTHGYREYEENRRVPA